MYTWRDRLYPQGRTEPYCIIYMERQTMYTWKKNRLLYTERQSMHKQGERARIRAQGETKADYVLREIQRLVYTQ